MLFLCEMLYLYTAFGIPIESEFELPALTSRESTASLTAPLIRILNRKVTESLKIDPIATNAYGQFNQTESWFIINGIAKCYVHDGTTIEIEALSINPVDINQLIYANCIPILLFQRNQILLHCSGVYMNGNEVVLFAAPKFTGKSTLAVLLQQKGYSPFTDDTALITFDLDQCYAHASYPMIRLDDKSLANQHTYTDADKKISFNEEDNKSGFYFHTKFTSAKAKVKAIVFLEKDSDWLRIEKITPRATLPLLQENIYRRFFLMKMKKQALEFNFLSNFAHLVQSWKAVRPKDLPSYTDFTNLIETEIIKPLIKN